MKTVKELRVSDLQQIRGAVASAIEREEYTKNCEDGQCKSSEIVKNLSASHSLA